MNSLLIKRSSDKHKRYPSNNSSRLGSKEMARQYFLKAKNKQSEDKHLQALDFYIKATIYDTEYFQAFCNMGSCYRSLGKYPQSKNCYLRAIKINPTDAISNYNLANLYRIISDYEQSIKHYNFIISHQENGQEKVGDLYINSLINVGICYKNLGLYEKAIAIYEKVNQIAPHEEVGYFNHAMNILSLIQQNTTKKVNKFDVELANRATMLFDKVLDLNASNKMVKLAKLKLKVLVDRSSDVVNKAQLQLKSYEKQSGFENLQEEIQETIKFVSSFNSMKINLFQSVTDLLKQANSQQSIPSSKSLFSVFQNQTDNYLQTTLLTQQQGIQLINNGDLAELQTILAKTKDSLLKGVLQLALNLQKAQRNSKYIDRAYQIYLKYFVSPQTQQCITFDRISSTGHQLIGKLLNLRNQFKQASLHFQYCSDVLKRKASSSAIAHNDIGEGLQAAGNMKQAIDEYLLAFKLQPQNEKISYNLGCCLFENGRYDEALEYFRIFMQTLDENTELSATEKQLWETECLILIALTNTSKKQGLKSYLLAYDRLKQLRMKAGEPQLQQQHLFCFFQHLSALLEDEFSTHQSQLNRDQLQQLLIDVYSQLLSFSSCEEREVVTLNLGNLCYQSKRYLKAIQNFLQIKNTIIIPYQKIALCYLRLIEPQMTLKYIELQHSINKRSLRVHFLKDIIQWIYFNQNQGTYNKQLPAVREDLFYERNQSAISLIDKFQAEIRQRKIEFNDNVSELIDELLVKPSKLRFGSDYQNIKLDKIATLLHKYPVSQPPNNLIPQQILKICFASSNQPVAQQLQKLLRFANNLPNQGFSRSIIQTLLHVLIYCNQKEIHIIKNQLSKQAKFNSKEININIDIVSCSDDFLSIQPDFDCLKKLVVLLVEWQQVLSVKTNQIITIVQQIYYNTNIAKCLQTEYHFPRHSYIADSDQTFYKLAFIIMKVLRMDIKLNSKGSKLPQIKKELISQFQFKFNHQLKSIKLKPIQLNHQFIPVTLTAYHHTKAETELFIQTLLSIAGLTEPFAQNCDYYSVIINKIVRVVCKWGAPFTQSTISAEIIHNIISNPIYIANQSVIALVKLLPTLSQYSNLAHKFIQQESTLQF